MSSDRRSGGDSLSDALGAVLEGVTFYELGQKAVADTRVKVTFEELGRLKRDQLVRLEASTPPATKDAVRPAGIYPVEAVAKVECYVCGYAADTKAMPSACPSCGAARYSFEKEIALSKAWEIAGASARKSSDLFRSLAAKASGATRALLEALALEDEGIAKQADQHTAELRT